MWFVETYDAVRYALARVATLEVILLLTIYPCDDPKHIQLLVAQQSLATMDTHLSADFTEHLAQQCKQSHYHLSCLLVSVLTLLPVSQIRLLYPLYCCTLSSIYVHLAWN